MKQKNTDRSTSDTGPIFVVGAGPSGLTAAHRLRREGQEVIVFDLLDRIGGQVHTHREAGYLMEDGATILPSAYKAVIKIVEEAGVADQLISAGKIIGFCRDREIHNLNSDHLFRDGAKSKLISWPSKLAMVRFAIDNARISKHLNYEDLSNAVLFDNMTPKQYCEKHLGLGGEVYEYIIDSTDRGVLGTRGDKTSLTELFFMINNILGSTLYAFRDGYSRFVEAVAAPLDVRRNAKVQEIVETADGVRFTWVDSAGATHTEDGAGAIVTIRGDWVPDILPGYFDSYCDKFLRSLKYTKTIVMNTGVTKKPKGVVASVINCPRLVDEGLMGFTCEHNKAPGRAPEGKGLLCFLTMHEWAEEHFEDDDDTLRRLILISAEKIMPGISDTVDFTRIIRWGNIVVYSRPGIYRDLGEFMKKRPKNTRIQLGGTYFSSSDICTAVTSGERAVRELLPVVRAEAASRRLSSKKA